MRFGICIAAHSAWVFQGQGLRLRQNRTCGCEKGWARPWMRTPLSAGWSNLGIRYINILQGGAIGGGFSGLTAVFLSFMVALGKLIYFTNKLQIGTCHYIQILIH